MKPTAVIGTSWPKPEPPKPIPVITLTLDIESAQRLVNVIDAWARSAPAVKNAAHNKGHEAGAALQSALAEYAARVKAREGVFDVRGLYG
jgi:hypothetical protein